MYFVPEISLLFGPEGSQLMGGGSSCKRPGHYVRRRLVRYTNNPHYDLSVYH